MGVRDKHPLSPRAASQSDVGPALTRRAACAGAPGSLSASTDHPGGGEAQGWKP